MSDKLLKAQIDALIRDEIQEVINDYVDTEEQVKTSGLGFDGHSRRHRRIL